MKKTDYFPLLVLFALLMMICDLNLTFIAINSSHPLFIFIFLPVILVSVLFISLLLWTRQIIRDSIQYKPKYQKLFYQISFALVQIAMFLLCLQIYYISYEKTQDVQKINPDQLIYLQKENVFFVNEEITIGFAWSLNNMIKQHPDVKTIYLRSGGGNLNEAILGEELLNRAGFKHVRVIDMCYSSCTVLFFPAVEKEIRIDSDVSIHGCELIQDRNILQNITALSLKNILNSFYKQAGISDNVINLAIKQGCDDDVEFFPKDLLRMGIATIYYGKKPQYLMDKYNKSYGKSKK